MGWLCAGHDHDDHDGAAGENLSVLLAKRSKKEEFSLRDKLKELFQTFNHRLIDALAKATKQSLDTLRRRNSYTPSGHRFISSSNVTASKNKNCRRIPKIP